MVLEVKVGFGDPVIKFYSLQWQLGRSATKFYGHL